MSLAGLPLRSRTTTLFLCFLLLVIGTVSFFKLGRLEDPTYTIKMCVVAALDPGADAEEVHRDVALPLTRALHSLEEVDTVVSRSMPDKTLLLVTLHLQYREKDLPAIWTKIRQKVSDTALELPPGVKTVVQDDFADVYGQLYALQGDGYSLSELEDYAKKLKRDLADVPGVASVTLVGGQTQGVYLDFDGGKLATLGMPLDALFAQLLSDQLPGSPGRVTVGPSEWRIDPAGSSHSTDDLKRRTILTPSGFTSLGDLAQITEEPLPPSFTFDFNGRPAIGIGISTVKGGNVVQMGEAVKAKLATLDADRPAGMTLTPVYLQSDEVTTAVKGFLNNVIASVAVVIGVLLIFMGLRTGLLVGIVLMLIIAATLVTMQALGIFMQIVSLGSLIMALGMLVDNAIVVSEGLLVGIEAHRPLDRVSEEIIGQTFWPLLGGTLIAVISFSPIGLNNDLTGEYCKSLFQVVAISLLWSWILAILATPALGSLLLKRPEQKRDALDKPLIRAYRRALDWSLRHRTLCLVTVVFLFGLSLFGFTRLTVTFFPSTASPYFTVDLWSPQDTSLEEHRRRGLAFATRVRELDNVRDVTLSTGSGGVRFMLTLNPELPNPSYSQLLVRCTDIKHQPAVMQKVSNLLEQNTDLRGVAKAFSKGGGFVPKVEARLSGTDNDRLRAVARKVENLFRARKESRFVRTDWRERVPVLRPRINEAAMRQLGLSYAQINRALAMATGGTPVGYIMSRGMTAPLMARLKGSDRSAPGLDSVPLWTLGGRTSPFKALAPSTDLVWENPVIIARDGVKTLTVQTELTDPDGANAFWKQLHRPVENLAAGTDVTVSWGGERETSLMATRSVVTLMPLAGVLMFCITLALFNAFRQPLIIYLCMPLVLIGVTPGLLFFRRPFSFMALLGLISLFGMLAKNSIVLLDQIAGRMKEGHHPYQVILDCGVSRLRPVSLSALTTVLGMIPLVPDPLFGPLAITITAGLTVSTILTLFVVPMLTMLFWRVGVPQK